MMKWLLRITLIIFALALLAPQTMQPPVNAQSQSFGTNWVGQFYNNPNLQDPVVNTAVYPNGLNANWGTGAPLDGLSQPIVGVNADQFSARFTTSIPFNPGFYEFFIVSDDGARVFIDGQLIIDAFTAGGQRTRSAIVNIGGGVVTITVEYFDDTGPALLQFYWFTSTGTPVPTPTGAPIASGSVAFVRGLAVRTGPYLGASLVAVARPENSYPILAKNTSEGLFTWYQIQFNENTVGWSSGRYLVPEGNLDAVPLIGSVFDTIDNAPDRGVIGTTRSVMNFRVRPTPRVARVADIPQIGWGEQVQIIGRTIQGGRDFWYQVRYRDRVGWILAAYVGVSGNPIDLVPVY